MKRIVYYVFVNSAEALPADRIAQIRLSLGSLREHNRQIPVIFLLAGSLPSQLRTELDRLDVNLVQVTPYVERLRELCGPRAEVLARYPCLQKWIYFEELLRFRPGQLLYLDTDTFFRGDVADLFDAHVDKKWYAREEVYTSASQGSHQKVNYPDYIDERELCLLAGRLGFRELPCFSTGVVLMNHGAWNDIRDRLTVFLDVLWRFMVWLAIEPREARRKAYLDIAFLRENVDRLVTSADRSRALKYPAQNEWIKDQVSLALALGSIADFSYDFLAVKDVLLSVEFDCRPADDPWIVLHYFSSNMKAFLHHLSRTRIGRAWIEAAYA